MSFTIEALLGIQPKVEDEELPVRIPRSCSEDEESNEEDIELEGKSLVCKTRQDKTSLKSPCQVVMNSRLTTTRFTRCITHSQSND